RAFMAGGGLRLYAWHAGANSKAARRRLFAFLLGYSLRQNFSLGSALAANVVGEGKMPSPYDPDLDRTPANSQPLTPLSFLARAAAVYPDHPAVIHGARRFTYREFYTRTRRLASALAR